MHTKIIKVGVLALSLAMLGGCGNMKQMQADIDAANTAASAAMSKATEAYNLASKGHGIASEAALAASKAQATADSALECCNENSAKIDRMFEKAMMK
ncbi:MAG: hypothetical protein DHS20C09_06260 [marine bacterium B5-7]|nr:MAG: hypothetical protein DHS20C09_06260 [marine bacterium B5-7]